VTGLNRLMAMKDSLRIIDVNRTATMIRNWEAQVFEGPFIGSGIGSASGRVSGSVSVTISASG